MLFARPSGSAIKCKCAHHLPNVHDVPLHPHTCAIFHSQFQPQAVAYFPFFMCRLLCCLPRIECGTALDGEEGEECVSHPNAGRSDDFSSLFVFFILFFQIQIKNRL